MLNNTNSCNRNMSREKLMLKVQQLGFTLYELNLYLDSHPTCRAALTHFQKIQNEYYEAVKLYEHSFGPIKAGSGLDCSEEHWHWVDHPWPWENEHNSWEVK